MERVTVSAGTFSSSLRVEQKAIFVVNFTTGGSATLIQTNTEWLAPNVGRVKVVQGQVNNGPVLTLLRRNCWAMLWVDGEWFANRGGSEFSIHSKRRAQNFRG